MHVYIYIYIYIQMTPLNIIPNVSKENIILTGL